MFPRAQVSALWLLAVAAAPLACKSSDASKGAADAASSEGGMVAVPGLNGPVLVDPTKPAGVNADPDAGYVPKGTAARLLEKTNPDKLPIYSGPTGTLEGTVFVVGDSQPAITEPFGTCDTPAARTMHGHVFRDERAAETKISPTTRRPLLDAIVGVTDYGKVYLPAPSTPEIVRIKDCALDRRVVVLMLGQGMQVRNDDTPAKEHYYGPQLVGVDAASIRVVAPGTDPIPFLPEAPGRFLLGDTMNHKYLRADIFVAMNPLNTVTQAAGKYKLAGIPVGKVKAHVMHPGFLNASKDVVEASVEVRANETTTQDFVLTYKKP